MTTCVQCVIYFLCSAVCVNRIAKQPNMSCAEHMFNERMELLMIEQRLAFI